MTSTGCPRYSLTRALLLSGVLVLSGAAEAVAADSTDDAGGPGHAGVAAAGVSPRCLADLDRDGDVDRVDVSIAIVIVLLRFGPCDGACPLDFDRSGVVDRVDLWILVAFVLVNLGPCESISVAVSPPSLSVEQGQSGATVVELSRAGGFDEPVTVSVEGSPPGVAVPDLIIGPGASSGTLTLAVAATAAPGSWAVTLRASGAGVAAATTTLGLTVTEPAPPPVPAWLEAMAAQLSQGNSGRAVTIAVRLADGRVWAVSAGTADEDSGAAARVEDLVEVGSSTKMYTAATLLRLHEAGQLDVEAPITEYLPAALFAGLLTVPPQDVKVWMLLNHTSGMADYLNIGDDAETLRLYAGQQDDFTPQELLRLTRDLGRPPQDPPVDGSARYSNAGYVILGLLVEAVTGLSWEDAVRREVIEPLSLERTGFLTRGDRSQRTGYATGLWSGGVVLPGTAAWSAGAIVADPRDLAEFLFRLAEGGLYTSPQTLDLQLQGHPSQRGSARYGLGIQTQPAQGSDLIGHDGQTFGFVCYPTYATSTRAVVVINVNDSQASVPLSFQREVHRKVAES